MYFDCVKVNELHFLRKVGMYTKHPLHCTGCVLVTTDPNLGDKETWLLSHAQNAVRWLACIFVVQNSMTD